ncbi:MAG: hypothetical protein AB1765_05975 [Candidatus Hydrogenedentota bacterium]
MATTRNVLTIPKKITRGEELVILTREEYENTIAQNKEILKVLKIIAEGEETYRKGETISASSLEESLVN